MHPQSPQLFGLACLADVLSGHAFALHRQWPDVHAGLHTGASPQCPFSVKVHAPPFAFSLSAVPSAAAMGTAAYPFLPSCLLLHKHRHRTTTQQEHMHHALSTTTRPTSPGSSVLIVNPKLNRQKKHGTVSASVLAMLNVHYFRGCWCCCSRTCNTMLIQMMAHIYLSVQRPCLFTQWAPKTKKKHNALYSTPVPRCTCP